MSNINLSVRHIFVHIPKTGGTSMTNVPWNSCTYYNYWGHNSISDMKDFGVDINTFFKWCFVRNPWDRLLSGYDHGKEFHTLFPTFESMVKATYQYRKTYNRLNYKWAFIPDGIPGVAQLKPTSPELFLVSQSSFITIDDQICMDYIGRFENLQQDWATVCNKVKQIAAKSRNFYKNRYITPEDYNLPHKRNRKEQSHTRYTEKPYQEYYTKEMKEMVEEIYQNDIVNFNYKFE